MVQVDLITGFLGSGKTTFIKKYAKWGVIVVLAPFVLILLLAVLLYLPPVQNFAVKQVSSYAS